MTWKWLSILLSYYSQRKVSHLVTLYNVQDQPKFNMTEQTQECLDIWPSNQRKRKFRRYNNWQIFSHLCHIRIKSNTQCQGVMKRFFDVYNRCILRHLLSGIFFAYLLRFAGVRILLIKRVKLNLAHVDLKVLPNFQSFTIFESFRYCFDIFNFLCSSMFGCTSYHDSWSRDGAPKQGSDVYG